MEKTFTSTQKFIVMSPRKLRLVAALVRRMRPAEAVERLPFVGKRAGQELGKVIKSALANAKAKGVGETDLIFKEIQIGEGPRLKRGRAASRGRWAPFKRRMSHIRVVLMSTKPEITNQKTETPAVKGERPKGTKPSSENEHGTKS